MSMVIATAAAAQVSPLDYGLREATSGMGRYFALYNAHVDALYRGLEVNYDGIDTLEIELPPKSRRFASRCGNTEFSTGKYLFKGKEFTCDILQ